eukprot:CAMPEP_0195020822 /NCGR_PEP_ID=MMETSP0326_2-20130528/36287_1 /TAXON_ID=2866 ORGANISM="Crypthecodinium cohnii, Strain Seligo" /NCGR_SAMPLE_ID=MMETSP0326_2 /ASSEMBLY_ACC=CAM_ASM_000348 /LENGTH=73 /DNA_ID=CAMNT_0040039669 /DNA_START=74 /DNA_END=291 /DNA_ORIENTATION=+
MRLGGVADYGFAVGAVVHVLPLLPLLATYDLRRPFSLRCVQPNHAGLRIQDHRTIGLPSWQRRDLSVCDDNVR